MKLRKLERKLRARLTGFTNISSERAYTIGNFTITVPTSHLMPSYQTQFRLYDRFLLSLGTLPAQGWMIDIGANVGDSAAALLSGPLKKLLCLEPAPEFFPMLERNAAVLRNGGSTVLCLQYGVGPDGETAGLAINVSTASMTPGESGMTLISLDKLVSIHCEQGPVDLIKCDVDGYDIDVLRSGIATLKRDEPVLYFEAEMFSAKAIENAVVFFSELTTLGYGKLTAFDNFGLLLAESLTPEALCDLLRYTLAQNSGKSTRTFHYVDVLCSTPKHRSAHNAALQHYKATWL